MELRVSLRRPGQEGKNATKIKNDDNNKDKGKNKKESKCNGND